jgi:integrase
MQAYTAARLPHVESKETLRICASQISRLVGNLEPRMVSRSSYITSRAGGAVSDGSVRREVGVLRAALSWAVRERWITEAPYIEMPPRPPARERWLTREAVADLRRAAASPHIRLFIVLAYHTAARRGAILDLTWDRVDLERRLISYDRPGRRATKKRRATVPINTAALAELQAARPLSVSDHVIEFRGRPVASIKTGFAAACRRAGVAASPHVLRHSAATHMVMAGVPMVEIARMLGDTVAMIEQVYGKHSPDFLRRAADALMGEGPKLERMRK